MGDLNWTDDQWRKVKDAVTDSFGKASVASAFLPLYGPLSGSTETVRNERLNTATKPTVRLEGDQTEANQRLVNVTVKVELSSEQVADESLSNAILAFRRAANIVAQEEDRIVLRGYDPAAAPSDYVVNGPTVVGLAAAAVKRSSFTPGTLPNGDPAPPGPLVVTEVVKAISHLEQNSNPSPFACVLSNELFVDAHEPSTFSLVLPADRIGPMLNGPLLRSSGLPPKAGIVVSLSANALDIVVATAPTVQFLQRTVDARYLFRVYTRFALRIRDTGATTPIVEFEKT